MNRTKEKNTRAFVLHPDILQKTRQKSEKSGPRQDVMRSVASRLDEALGLARALGLDIVAGEVVRVANLRPATLFGKGKVEHLRAMFAAHDVELVIINHELTPVQQRNLEKAWNVKVLDRTGLILEIFGERAQTREGRLQVELANLNYQKSRLVRSWTHLERQRGGVGFTGGPGETQIEADRRMIRNRIRRLEKELESVKRTRSLHRKSRKKVPYPIVALVGYTNAGKSTLFNRMANSDVMAKDMLFATLDPTMRQVVLKNGKKIILSDTVGFISSLPTELVAAFRATLEEVLEADIILHVRDFAHDETKAQAFDVEHILHELGVQELEGKLIEVWNKTDEFDVAEIAEIRRIADERDNVVAISALKGEGLDDLAELIARHLGRDSTEHRITLDAHQGRQLNWLYENCEIIGRKEQDDARILLDVRVPAAKLAQFRSLQGA